MSTLDLHEAADRAKCHPDTMRKLMKAGEAPGGKVGRKWFVSERLFQDWLDKKCDFTNAPGAHSGGSALAERLASRAAQLTKQRRVSSANSSRNDSGDETPSGTVVPFRGKRLQDNG